MVNNWYYLENGEQKGPISTQELKEMAVAGSLQPNDLVFREGTAAWVTASKIKGLFPEGAPPPLQPRQPPPAQPPASTAFDDSPAPAPPHDGSSQSFGDAIGQSFSQAFSALGQLLRHPFRLAMLTFVFSIASSIAIASLVGSILFPVFAMGYVGCIRATITGERAGLEGFIAFMRHGWDSLWHLLMMLASFIVTLAAMIAPAIIAAIVIYFLFGTVAPIFQDHGHSRASHTHYSQSVNGVTVYDSDVDPVVASRISATDALMALIISSVLIVLVMATPAAVAGILCFFLALEVSSRTVVGDRRFDLVYDAFVRMLKMAKVKWKELVVSGFICSGGMLCLLTLHLLGAYLLAQMGWFGVAEWTGKTLMPITFTLFGIYITVFICLVALSLGGDDKVTR